jgi:hypothetical protein
MIQFISSLPVSIKSILILSSNPSLHITIVLQPPTFTYIYFPQTPAVLAFILGTFGSKRYGEAKHGSYGERERERERD